VYAALTHHTHSNNTLNNCRLGAWVDIEGATLHTKSPLWEGRVLRKQPILSFADRDAYSEFHATSGSVPAAGLAHFFHYWYKACSSPDEKAPSEITAIAHLCCW